MSTYACVAATAAGARCRNMSREGKVTCGISHNDSSPTATAPDRIFVKFKLDDDYEREMRVAGIHIAERSYEKQRQLNDQHTGHAQAYGRKATAFRSMPDSGVPVFGENGIQMVSLSGLDNELRLAGYDIVDVHAVAGFKGTLTLVVNFSKGTPVQVTSTPAIRFASTMFKFRSWGACYVWANPPDANGVITHTVNLKSIRNDAIPNGRLLFFSGLWRNEAK
jgi:hypothetical protein